MGSADRDYFKDEERRYSGGGGFGGIGSRVTPVVKWLIIINAILFFIDLFSRRNGSPFGVINEPFCFAIRSAFMEGKVWELFTFQFLHASPWHLLANCLGLFFFGPWAERWWGAQRFLIFYLLSGAAGALFFTVLTLSGILPQADELSPLVGASAGVYAILIHIAVINPKERVRLLFPPVEMALRTLALGLVGFGVIVVLGSLFFTSSSVFRNSGGEAGHLGGAIGGYFFTRFPWVLRKGAKKKSGSESKIIRPKEFRGPAKSKLGPRTSVEMNEDSEIDRILDKINREGMDRLSKQELEILHNPGKKPPTSRDS